MKAQDTIDRVTRLSADGVLTGKLFMFFTPFPLTSCMGLGPQYYVRLDSWLLKPHTSLKGGGEIGCTKKRVKIYITYNTIFDSKFIFQFFIVAGVIDDRGKFIYISQSELEAVAKWVKFFSKINCSFSFSKPSNWCLDFFPRFRFIKQRGRVSITELAENSNKLIAINTSWFSNLKYLFWNNSCFVTFR